MNRRSKAFSFWQYAIIADDLTGSLDTGLQFHKKGLTTYVPLNWNRPSFKGDALVLNTNSRNIPGEEAYLRIYEACRKIKTKGLYKKIDSTMRGNVGKEALAILDARKIAKAIVVPTVPVMGRTVENGILRVHGVPLLRTPYAQDPFHPIFTSHLRDLLARETGQPVGYIGLNSVRKGPSFLAGKIDSHPARLLVLDAVVQTDLRMIAAACEFLPGKVLPCGSVSLADELNIPVTHQKKGVRKKSKGPVLIISASRNPRTREQIVIAQDSFSFPLMEPDLDALTHPRLGNQEIQRLVARIPSLLAKSGGIILTTTFQEHRSGQEEVIPKALGKVAALVLRQRRLGGLVLTGGDLAMGIYGRLAAKALRIEDEVSPGIPCSTLADGPFANLRLVTKAGGFGEKDAMVKIVQYLMGI
jgi:D-threonate/D-erythronate kinase